MDKQNYGKSILVEKKKAKETSFKDKAHNPAIIKAKTTNYPTRANYHSNLTCVYKEDQNKNFKKSMEDVSLIRLDLENNPKHHLFAIFDGHGGRKCAQMSSEKYPEILSKCLKENPINISKCITKSFHVLDKAALDQNCMSCGNTATVVYIAGRLIYCANVGDSKCVIISTEGVSTLTKDDKSTDQDEIKRIESAGGKIINKRVGGILAISRAIGDHELKDQGLISIPHLEKHLISSNDRYCVIASDGVWDVLTDGDLITLSQNAKNSKQLAEDIVNTSIKNGSGDNISCIVIAFYE